MAKKIYISGKITGLSPDEVKAKFEAAETKLKEQGYDVVSPLKNGLTYNTPWIIHIILDIIYLLSCDAIYLLPDWEYSKGATLEKSVAEHTGKEVIFEEKTLKTNVYKSK